MALYITQRPFYYSFSKNDVLWQFYCTNPSVPGTAVDILITASSASDVAVPALTHQQRLSPAANGYVNFNLADVINSMIPLQIPESNPIDPIKVGTNIKKITMQYRLVTDANLTPDFVTDNFPVYVIKGGIERLKADYNNYFYNFHRINSPFATWLPFDRLVTVDEPWWMSVLFNNDFNNLDVADRMVRIRLEWTDNSIDPLDFPFPAATIGYFLYHINVGFLVADAIRNIGAGRVLWRFSVQVVAVQDPTFVFTQQVMLYADYRKFYDAIVFNYFNSLGGIDHVRLQGENETSYNRSYIESDVFTGITPIGSMPDRENLQTNIVRSNSTKSNVGFRMLKNEMLAYQEIFISELVWQIVTNSNKYRIISILNKSGKLINTNDQLFSLPIEWRYAFDEQVFTPETDFGKGVAMANTITCGLVGVITNITLEEEGGGAAPATYAATYPSIADADHVVFTFSIDGGTTWLTDINLITQTDTALLYAIRIGGMDVEFSRDHILKITPYCTPTLAGTSGTKSFVA